MAADPDELERRIRRLEALFSVLLLADVPENLPSKEWDRLLRQLLRPHKEPDFFLEDLYMYLREFGYPRRRHLEDRLEKLTARIDDIQITSDKFFDNFSAFQQQVGPLAQLQPEFQRIVEKQLPQLQYTIESVSNEQRDLRTELHSYLVAESMGLDSEQLRLQRFIPIQVYLSEDDRTAVRDISKAIGNLLNSFGFEISDDFPPQQGSWWKKWFAKSKEVATQPEVAARLKKVERAIELAQLQERQANIDEKQAKAAKEVLDALKDTPDAVCLVGSILTIKVSGNDNPCVYVRSLTPEEMIYLSNNQHLLKNPDTILESLSNHNQDLAAIEHSSPNLLDTDSEDEG